MGGKVYSEGLGDRCGKGIRVFSLGESLWSVHTVVSSGFVLPSSFNVDLSRAPNIIFIQASTSRSRGVWYSTPRRDEVNTRGIFIAVEVKLFFFGTILSRTIILINWIKEMIIIANMKRLQKVTSGWPYQHEAWDKKWWIARLSSRIGSCSVKIFNCICICVLAKFTCPCCKYEIRT